MTPLARFIRDAWERAFGSFYEGPSPPERLAQLVVEFANSNPRASRREWVEFGKRLADSCYRAGYVRGWEATVRDRNANWRRLPPELVADTLDPDWRWRPAMGAELVNPEHLVDAEPVEGGDVDLRKHAGNRPPG